MSLTATNRRSAARTQEGNGGFTGAKPAVPAGPSGAPVTAAEVFTEYGSRIRGLARRMLGNEADAEDVTQDVLLLVVRKLHAFRGESSLGTWIHRVTTNAALLHRRKKALIKDKAGAPELCAAAHDFPLRRDPGGPDEQAQRQEARQLIEAAVARLPRLYREAYVMSEMEELSNAEIGNRLGLSLPAVKSRIHRARLLLRRALAPHFDPADKRPAD